MKLLYKLIFQKNTESGSRQTGELQRIQKNTFAQNRALSTKFFIKDELSTE